jgi:hypothetical protein
MLAGVRAFFHMPSGDPTSAIGRANLLGAPPWKVVQPTLTRAGNSSPSACGFPEARNYT